MFKYFKKDESGQSLVLVALLLTVLMGFGALAIDVGYMTYQKSELQNAADAAALAGAGSIPTVAGVAIESTVVPDYLEDNIDDLMTVTVNKNVKVYDNTVEVTISQEVPKFLGGIFSSDTKTMTVTSKAKYTPGTPGEPEKEITTSNVIPKEQWSGEVMPFVNFDEGSLSMGTTFEVWEKVSGGYFECINNFTVENKETPSKLYFNVNLAEGLQIKNGVVAEKKDELQTYYTYHKSSLTPTPYIYIFSLSQKAFDNNEVKLMDGTVKSIDDLNNKTDFVHQSSLVLVKCTFENYIESGKDGKSIYLKPIKIYDLGNNDPGYTDHDDYPEGYVNPDGDIITETNTEIIPAIPEGKASIKLIK